MADMSEKLYDKKRSLVGVGKVSVKEYSFVMRELRRIFAVSLVTVTAAFLGIGDARSDIASREYVDSIVSNIDMSAKEDKTNKTTDLSVVGNQTDTAYPSALAVVTYVNQITSAISTAVTVNATGTGNLISNISGSGTDTLTVTKSNVQIPVGSATATTYANIWVE